jgi:glycosyltransferase involved in cell wall biosynthesis
MDDSPRMEWQGKQHVVAVAFRPDTFAARSGLLPLAEALGIRAIVHDVAWQRLARMSWTLGHLLRRAGQVYYGSEWNALIPLWDESRLAREAGRAGARLAHFLFAEFAAPRRAGPFRRRGIQTIGTFHCSGRRVAQVLGGRPDYRAFDWVTVMARCQEPYFLEAGVPRERLRVTPHGVDTRFFSPAAPGGRPATTGQPLRGLLVGATERDHEFLQGVLRAMPAGRLQLSVAAPPECQAGYRDCPGVVMLPRLTDEELLRAYREADLLVMPMLDSTANNTMLEAMACGTPVMTNRVGGVPDYVDASCNILMEGKQVEDWLDRIARLSGEPGALTALRPSVRQWAERFEWHELAGQYVALYEEALSLGPTKA